MYGEVDAPRWRSMGALVGACVVALPMMAPVATAAGAAKHKHHPNPLTPVARRALLRTSDIGFDWRSAPAPKKVPTLTCPSFSPVISGLSKPGQAASPTFRQTSSGPFVSQAAYVYASDADAIKYWKRTVKRQLGTCVEASLTAGSTQSVAFKAHSMRTFSLPTIGDRDAGYRVIGSAITTAQTLRVYLDMIVVGRGSGLSQVSFSSFSQPPSRSLELRLARIVAGRLPQDRTG